MSKLAVIALGGNAITRGDEKGTIEEQYKNSSDTIRNLIYLLKDGYNLVLSHGNGPQVGNILLRNDAGEEIYDIPQMPLDICVADSQGGIGYMLEKMLRNILKEEGIDREVVTIVTQVVVSKDDPAFKNYTKRVGKLYSKERADEMAAKKGWVFKENSKNDDKWRRVVPSPEPKEIMNERIIKDLVNAGVIVIASGGGGIPVYYDEKGMLQALEAVIDKDAASSLLASRIGADEFYILTDVPYVYANYGTPQQKIMEFLNKETITQMIDKGEFGEGSMLPKIKSALKFVENGGQKSVITEASKLEDRKFGSRITLN
ncbi:MAG: carbamate kinase [Flavobacteriaceae bacterium]|nr:carbamate kinase [Flavobacteriaceae bacterium]